MIVKIPESLDETWHDLFCELVIAPVEKKIEGSEHIGLLEFLYEIVFCATVSSGSIFLIQFLALLRLLWGKFEEFTKFILE